MKNTSLRSCLRPRTRRTQGDEKVLIAGAGPVGLMLLLGLKAMGVSTVYMTEVMEYRRKRLRSWAPRLTGLESACGQDCGQGRGCGHRSSRYQSDHKGLSVLGEASGKGHRSGHFHLAGVVAHARLRHPGGNHDRRQLHQSGIGSVLDSIRQYPPGEPDHRDYSPG